MRLVLGREPFITGVSFPREGSLLREAFEADVPYLSASPARRPVLLAAVLEAFRDPAVLLSLRNKGVLVFREAA